MKDASGNIIFNTSTFLNFPFLGSREDGEPFQYLLLSADSDGAQIAICNWLMSRVKLSLGEQLDLYIPSKISEEYLFRDEVSGKITSIERDEAMRTEVYKIRFDKHVNDFSLQHMFEDQFINLETRDFSLADLVIKLIKDSLILKSGIRVYFKHLIPYFSRIVNYNEEDYWKFKKVFLNGILTHIQLHETKLEELYNTLKKKLQKTEEIPVYLDLENLREVLESEISLPIFNIAFSENDLSVSEQFEVQPEFGYSKYINAIKDLEKRLYSNYNMIVIIYLNSMS